MAGEESCFDDEERFCGDVDDGEGPEGKDSLLGCATKGRTFGRQRRGKARNMRAEQNVSFYNRISHHTCLSRVQKSISQGLICNTTFLLCVTFLPLFGSTATPRPPVLATSLATKVLSPTSYPCSQTLMSISPFPIQPNAPGEEGQGQRHYDC